MRLHGCVLSLAGEGTVALALLRRTDVTDTTSDCALHARILAEYREMPGMRLTVMQAARLFNVDPARCAQALDTLVAEGALWTNGREFVAPNAGRHTI